MRDRWTCQYCGALATTVDHKLRREHGGTDALTNLVACCKPCQQPENRSIDGRFFSQRSPGQVPVREISLPNADLRPIRGEMTRK